jgi:spermidine synthase
MATAKSMGARIVAQAEHRAPPVAFLSGATITSSVEVLIISLLFVASGAAALIYEVLWLKQLGLLFGSSAQAAAVTLAVFFAGMSLGARALGERAGRSAAPLRGYALLEIAIPLTAVLYFILFDVYQAIYPVLATRIRAVPFALTAIKLTLAALILLPPAICMGGTVPYMTQHMVRRRADLGGTFSWLYACNTVGGALGAFAAAFYLPPMLGYTRSYGVAMSLNLAVAALAWTVSRGYGVMPARAARDPARAEAAAARLEPRVLAAAAFFSGAATLGLEVLWTRMFAQVLHNSVYSFATILVTFLLTLALGAAAANRLFRLQSAGTAVLPTLLVLAGLSAGLSPHLFQLVTGGVHYLAPSASWSSYVLSVFAAAAAVLAVPGICMGMVFPYLLRLAGQDDSTPARASAGAIVGRLMSWNTIGSILGSLLSGFVLIEWLGLWGSIRAIAFAYFAVALLLLPMDARRLQLVLIAAMAAVLVFLDPTRLPLVLMTSPGETLREKWETGQAIVAVTQTGQDRLIKVDNYYSLGGTSARAYEEAQADIPLIVHPRPRDVFFLGLGSGITAGAALQHDVQRVTVAELLPDVVTASQRHFKPYTNGLFEDPRARIVVEDGRQHLLTTSDRYDVIVSDLFIPWQAGAGSLYTREHFQLARARLRPGGLFAQWLPMYQLSQREAFIIIRTMLEEFPQVTLWRGDFMPDHPILVLIGQEQGATLDPDAVTTNFRFRRKTPALSRRLALAFTGLFYAGNLTAHRARFAGSAINTDDLPLIEYLAPIAQREHAGGKAGWFTGFSLVQFEHDLLERLMPQSDPYLARLTPEERDFVLGGLDLTKTMVHQAAQQPEEAARHAAAFERHIPPEVYAVFKKDIGTEPAATGDDSQ